MSDFDARLLDDDTTVDDSLVTPGEPLPAIVYHGDLFK